MPKLSVNGVTLHYEDTGGGPETVVLAHGLLWSGRMFDAQVAALRPRYRCITFDFRGQGQTPMAAGGYDMDTLSDDAAALIGALDAGPCHFVGLSMGGFVGLRLALRRPELLRSLTLLESAGDAEPRLNVPKYALLLVGARLIGMRAFLRPVMRIMFGSAFLRDPARAAERRAAEEHLAGLDLDAVERALGGVTKRATLTSELGRVHTPTLVVVGADDRAVLPARAERTAQAIAGARFVMLPRAGHTSSVEEPAAVTEALLSFWAELAVRAA